MITCQDSQFSDVIICYLHSLVYSILLQQPVQIKTTNVASGADIYVSHLCFQCVSHSYFLRKMTNCQLSDCPSEWHNISEHSDLLSAIPYNTNQPNGLTEG